MDRGNTVLTAEQEWMANTMDDTMSKEKAADLLDNLIGMVDDTNGNNYDDALRMGIEALKADAVKVVRCKDCYHYDEESEKCILNNSEMKPMDYCSYGSE